MLLLAGCVTAVPGNDAVLSNSRPGPPGNATGALFVIHRESMGPLTQATRAELPTLQDLLGSRYVVKQVDKDELDVMLDKEVVFYVIANDDGSLFNVHCPSEKVAIADHPDWIIRSPLTNDQPIDACECWGSHPMCFHNGDHVAIGFEVPCEGLETAAKRKALVGVPIQRAVWNPRPFGDGSGGAGPRGTKSILTPP